MQTGTATSGSKSAPSFAWAGLTTGIFIDEATSHFTPFGPSVPSVHYTRAPSVPSVQHKRASNGGKHGKLACVFVQYSRIRTPNRASRLILWLYLYAFLHEFSCKMTVGVKVLKARRPATQYVLYLLRLRFSILPGYWSAISVGQETFRHQPTEWTDPQLHSARAH